MKITDIRTLCLSRPHELQNQWFSSTFHVEKADCPIVIIDTDANLQGIAEPSTYGDPPIIKERLDALKPTLIGRDPLDPDLVPPKPTGDRALHIVYAGLELAQWDLRAKAQNKQVAELIIPLLTPDAPNRTPRKTLRIYASGGVQYDWDDNPESVVDEAIALADRGFSAYKMRLGTEWGWSGITVARMLELLRKVTDAVGARMELMLEGNCRLDEAQAFAIGHFLDEAGWTWFEEPLPIHDYEGHRLLAEASSVKIATGENGYNLAHFKTLLDHKGASILNVDVSIVPGYDIAKDITDLAAQRGVSIAPHGCQELQLPLAAAVKHGEFLEYYPTEVDPLRSDMFYPKLVPDT